MRKWLCVLILGVWVAACASPPPFEEFSMARTALYSARDVEAARYASGFWHKAEEHYQRGQKFFKDNDFDRARQAFMLSIESAEKAENATRLRKFQSGEGTP